MHVFFESVWKLHIGEIPEKPKERDYIDMSMDLPDNSYYNDLQAYDESIADIKQNALTVWNPERITTDEVPGIAGKPYKPGEFYFWPGGYETKETYDKRIVTAGGMYKYNLKTVAILTLPEEKKNTMENLTKEQHARLIAERLREDAPTMRGVLIRQNVEHAARMLESFAESSGSVAAPKEEDPWSWVNYEAAISLTKPMLASPEINQYYEMVLNKAKQADAELASIRQQLETLRGFVKEVDASLYHGPDLEDKEIMQHYIEVFKIIKEEARNLLSK